MGRKMQTVRSVDRAARIMEALFLAPEGKHLSEISVELGLHKTTVLRLLRTLTGLGMVKREPATGHYRWEPLRWLTRADRMREVAGRAEILRRMLEELSEATGETVAVAIPDFEGRRAVMAASAAPSNVVHVDLAAVRAAPMHATAFGKALLSYLSDDEIQKWARGGLRSVTEHTITDPERLLEEIAGVRERGYAVASQENLPGVSEVAVALCDERERAAGAVGVAAAADRMTGSNIAAWVGVLGRAAGRLSGLLYSSGAAGGGAAVVAGAGAVEAGAASASSAPLGATEPPGPYRLV